MKLFCWCMCTVAHVWELVSISTNTKNKLHKQRPENLIVYVQVLKKQRVEEVYVSTLCVAVK